LIFSIKAAHYKPDRPEGEGGYPGDVGFCDLEVYDSPAIYYAMTVEQAAKHVIFTGHVQGVGFRYTARSIARQYPVSGYVRNLPDGTVEMFVQGAPADIDNYIQDVQQELAGHVHETQIEPAPINPRYQNFEIAF
jgi:acylphosphatase